MFDNRSTPQAVWVAACTIAADYANSLMRDRALHQAVATMTGAASAPAVASAPAPQPAAVSTAGQLAALLGCAQAATPGRRVAGRLRYTGRDRRGDPAAGWLCRRRASAAGVGFSLVLWRVDAAGRVKAGGDCCGRATRARRT